MLSSRANTLIIHLQYPMLPCITRHLSRLMGRHTTIIPVRSYIKLPFIELTANNATFSSVTSILSSLQRKCCTEEMILYRAEHCCLAACFCSLRSQFVVSNHIESNYFENSVGTVLQQLNWNQLKCNISCIILLFYILQYFTIQFQC